MQLVIILLAVSSIASWGCILIIMCCVPSNIRDIIDLDQSKIQSNSRSIDEIAKAIGELRECIDELHDLKEDVTALSTNLIKLDMKLEKVRGALL